MGTLAERGLWLPAAADRTDLRVFAERALRLDPAAVIRLRARGEGRVAAWVATGFDVLAARTLAGRVRPADLCAGADALLAGLAGAGTDGHVDPGYPMDSSWRGVLPPEHGFGHLDDVPVAVLRELARRGAALAREQGAAGPPVSLLDQDVLTVTGAQQSEPVGIPMRCVFALTGMGFVAGEAEGGGVDPAEGGVEPADDGEVVRVRVAPLWLRIDARFGSVYRRRGDPALVLR